MALTKITRGVIKANENYDTHNINSTGIITAVSANFTGNVSVGGTLTYQDVTNIDSVGIITARDGIVISEDDAIHFRGTAADDADAILRASAGGGQLLINSRNDTIINIDSNNDSTDAHFAVGHGAATGSSTELFKVQESGDVTQNSGTFTIKAASGDSSGLKLSQESGDESRIFNHFSGPLTFGTGNTERLRITSGGNLLLGRNSDYWSSRSIVQEDKDGRTHLLIKNDNNHASASAGITLNAYGNSWAIDCGSHPNNTNALTFGLDASSGSPAEKLRITSGGRLLLGTSSDIRNGQLQVASSGAGTEIQITESSDAGGGPTLRITRLRGSNLGSPAPIQGNNYMGQVSFDSYDTGAYRVGAFVRAEAEQTWASGDCPTRLIMATTNDGASSPTERLRINSGGFFNFNQANNNNLQGRVTIFDGGNFSTNSVLGSGDSDNIYLISDATSGYNVYGSSIAWSRVQYADRRVAAIANVQTSTDEDHVGLAFFTHPSADATAAIEEKFRITHDGIHITNGVSNFYVAFRLANNQNYNWDIAVPNEGGYGNSFRCECGYNHYYTTNYGAHRSAWISARGTSTNNMFDQDQSHSQSGYWTFSKPNNTTFRVTKTAGTYGGEGYGFVHVRFNYF